MERYVGIDLGISTKHKVTVYDGPNRLGKPFSVETSSEGWEYLLKRATSDVDGPVNFVFEPELCSGPQNELNWTRMGPFLSRYPL
jgi:hypothetical protein